MTFHDGRCCVSLGQVRGDCLDVDLTAEFVGSSRQTIGASADQGQIEALLRQKNVRMASPIPVPPPVTMADRRAMLATESD